MTGPTGFDRTLSDWLDDMGAQDVPTARQGRRDRPGAPHPALPTPP